MATSTFFELAGMASDQAQNQAFPLSTEATGATVKPTLSATCDWFGSKTRPAAEVASIQIAHLPVWNSA